MSRYAKGRIRSVGSPSSFSLTDSIRTNHFIQSIYPEFVSSPILDGSLKLEIPVEFETSKSVMIFEPSPNTPDAFRRKPTVLTVSLSTLPPLLIHLSLPVYYPLHVPPQITSVRATHVWLPDVADSLSSLLLDLWQMGEPSLYSWIEFIRTGEFLEKLLLSQSSSDFISCV